VRDLGVHSGWGKKEIGEERDREKRGREEKQAF
jgi:hypothetical protein